MKLIDYCRSEYYEEFSHLLDWAKDEVDSDDHGWILYMPEDEKRRRAIPINNIVRFDKSGRWHGGLMLSAFDGFFVRMSRYGSEYLIAHYMW